MGSILRFELSAIAISFILMSISLSLSILLSISLSLSAADASIALGLSLSDRDLSDGSASISSSVSETEGVSPRFASACASAKLASLGGDCLLAQSSNTFLLGLTAPSPASGTDFNSGRSRPSFDSSLCLDPELLSLDSAPDFPLVLVFTSSFLLALACFLYH